MYIHKHVDILTASLYIRCCLSIYLNITVFNYCVYYCDICDSFQSYLTTDTDRGQRTETEEQSAEATIHGSGYRHASLYNLLQSEDVSTCKCPSWPQALCNGNIDVM